jgi:hypothetical protein
MRGRSRARLAIALALATAQLAIGAPEAHAASVDGQFSKHVIALNGTYIPIVGAFDCDEGNDGPPGDLTYEEPGVLLYAPGTAPDYLWTDLETAGGFQRTQTRLSINGTYIPVTGDFDGDRCGDILWYAPGAAPDYIWWGGSTGFTPGVRLAVNGSYLPVAGHFGGYFSNASDIFWYAPGASEQQWIGTGDRSSPFRPGSAPQVSGQKYRPVLFANNGSGAGELVFHGPGAEPDSAWRFGQSSNGMVVDRVTPLRLQGSYVPVGCRTKAVLHEPTSTDKLLTTDPVNYVTYDLTIAGSYRVAGSGGQTRGCVVVFHRPGAASDQIWFSST